MHAVECGHAGFTVDDVDVAGLQCNEISGCVEVGASTQLAASVGKMSGWDTVDYIPWLFKDFPGIQVL